MGLSQWSSRRARSWASWLLPIAAALWGSGWGCGGVVRDSSRNHDGGTSVAGTGGDTPVPSAGGSKPKPGPPKPGAPVCGNGILEGNELCDTGSFRTDLDTCQEAMMSANYAGQVLCSSNCTIDTSGCAQRNFGTGGASYAGAPNGGSFGAGGYAGGAGMLGFPSTPADDCYARGGVPDPSSTQNCSFGVDATNACFARPNQEPCASKCGCSNCPNVYDRCERDGACWWLFACAEQNGCYSVSACEKPCSQFFAMSGGVSTSSAQLLDQTLACFATYNCPLKCQ